MTTKLEKLIETLDALCCGDELGPMDFLAIQESVEILKFTRWRKLEEEKPTEEGEYEIAVPVILGSRKYYFCSAEWGSTDFNDKPNFGILAVTHWRPIVGPEDNNE